MLNHPWDPGMSPAWPWWMYFFKCIVRFSSILFAYSRGKRVTLGPCLLQVLVKELVLDWGSQGHTVVDCCSGLGSVCLSQASIFTVRCVMNKTFWFSFFCVCELLPSNTTAFFGTFIMDDEVCAFRHWYLDPRFILGNCEELFPYFIKLRILEKRNPWNLLKNLTVNSVFECLVF